MESRVAAKNEIPHSWWFDRRESPKPSPWLLSTLSDLERKTKQTLKLIEEDADSFAQRAEMYYKKRPQLVAMIQDFYRAHRSLAEQYDQLKSGGGTSSRGGRSFGRSASDKEDRRRRPGPGGGGGGGTHRSASSDGDWWRVAGNGVAVDEPSPEPPEFVDSEISEVDDPEREAEADERSAECDEVVKRMSRELERLRRENAALRAELAGKDEEKREVIRQLSLPLDVLKEENADLRKSIRDSRRSSGRHFELKKLAKEMFLGKPFGGGGGGGGGGLAKLFL